MAPPKKSQIEFVKKPLAPTPNGPDYQIACDQFEAHLYDVTLTVSSPQAPQILSLPVWIPGSYLVREFAKNLQGFSAQQNGRSVRFEQRDKCTWVVEAKPGAPLVIHYQIYAHDASVRTAWLDSQRGFFNATSLCLRVDGQTERPHTLRLLAPQMAWRVATALPARQVDRRGFGLYLAADYDELADSPFELGDFWEGSFEAHGVPHRFVVAGASASFDGDRLLADAQKICETALRFWHPVQAQAAPNATSALRKKAPAQGLAQGTAQGTAQGPDPRQFNTPPFKNYLFLLNAVDDNYGGLEHRASTALICGRRDLPRLAESLGTKRQPEGYNTLLGLISHEYFHSWNVKRLRPQAFARYDYSQENYTELLWFFEGFTSYYDDLLLRRAGLLDDTAYLKGLNKTLNQVLQAPGRLVQSVAEASFDAWVKYYRQDENTPNATISYYTKGALVALCFDLLLRAEGKANLDQVMRQLWQRTKAGTADGGPLTEADFAAVLSELGGRSFAKEIKAWVHGKTDLPLKALFEKHGIVWHEDPAQMAQRLGLRLESGSPLRLKSVLRGGAAEKAGMAAGDEWLAIEVGPKNNPKTKPKTWRLNQLEDLPLYMGTAKKGVAWVVRDQQVLRLPLVLPTVNTVRLAIADAAKMATWTQA